MRAILIAGPTASGKSSLATALAERLGGAVINVDSMQVYRELRVLTARPSVADEAQVPHHLYGHLAASERSSAGRWLSDAAAVLERLERAGTMPIFVGGTGLYFKVLTEGIADVPEVPEDLLRDWRGEAERLGAPVLHAILARRDPATAAALAVNDAQRIVRALSVLDATGRPLSEWQEREAAPPPLKLAETVPVFLDPPRELLRETINARFDEMLGAGALEEVETLRALNLDPALPAMRAHGVPHLIAHLEGRIELARAAARAKGDTRRYAKRQRTWFRHQMSGWRRVDPTAQATAETIESIARRVEPVGS